MKMMNCSLTLVCHSLLEDRLVDHLLEHPEWVAGFSTCKIEGNSQGEHLPSMKEQVRGRSQRVQIVMVMNLDDAHALLTHLKTEDANVEIAYWIAPLVEFGRLA